MRIGSKLVLGFGAVVLLTAFLGFVALLQLNKIAQPVNREIPQSIESLNNTSHLDSLAKMIHYYDEVLTQSARNYAFTQDKKWKERYKDTEPKLDKLIKEVLKKGDEEDRKTFARIDRANLTLVEMEYQSIDSVDRGQPEKAIAVLEGSDYWVQKEVYNKGLREFAGRRGVKYDEAVSTSSKTLETLLKRTEFLVKSSVGLILVFLFAALMLSLGISFLISHSILNPIRALHKGTEIIGSGNLDYKVGTSAKDEIGELSRAFDKMTESLKRNTTSMDKLNKEISEHKLADRELQNKMQELETFNKVAVDRELKMVELKNKIAELEEKLKKNA